jgi:hypothetical protein
MFGFSLPYLKLVLVFRLAVVTAEVHVAVVTALPVGLVLG